MNEHIVKQIDLTEDAFAYKVKDPVYHLMFRGASFNVAPYVAYFGEGKNRINETVAPFYFAPQYFHNFLEIFPKIIKLKQQGEDFKILLITNYYIDKETGLPEILIEGSPVNISSDNCIYLKEFYKKMGIDLMFISFDDFQATSFDYSYVFYEKSIDKSDFSFWKLWANELKIYCQEYKFNCFSQDLFLEGHGMRHYLGNIEIMKSFFPKQETNQNKHIYISRKNFYARKIDNEVEIEKYMIENGYEVVYLENHSVEDQVKIVRESSKIVCLSGSSLVNCMLANPGTKVIELSLDNPPIVELYSVAFKKYNIKHTFIHVEPNVTSIINSLKSII
jgi:hypothetical protein